MRLDEENRDVEKKIIHFKVMRVMRVNPPRPTLSRAGYGLCGAGLSGSAG